MNSKLIPTSAQTDPVQKNWKKSGCLLMGVLLIIGLLAVWRVFNNFNQADIIAARNSKARETLRSIKVALEFYYSNKQEYPPSLDKLEYKIPKEVLADCSLTPQGYLCSAAHREGTGQYFTSYTSATIAKQDYRAGDPVLAPRFVAR